MRLSYVTTRLVCISVLSLLCGRLVIPEALFAQEEAQVVSDWERGEWTFGQRSAAEQSLTRITFAGDWRLEPPYTSMFMKNPEVAYGEMLPVLQESDVTLVNVETTVGTKGEPIPKGGPNFQADPEVAVKGLTAVPFDVALLANNHAADYGPASVQETVRRLQAAGLKTVDASMSYEEATEPLFLHRKGTSIAVINCAEGKEDRSVDGGPGVYGMNVPVQKAQIQALRPVVDVIIVAFHGGRQYLPSPPPYVVEAMRTFARAGADAVIAHHPHVPQGIEVVEGIPIVYGQGNFVFWQSQGYYRRIGYLVSLDVASTGLVSMDVTPYQQTQEGLIRLPDPHRSKLMQDLKKLSGYLENGRAEMLWNAYIDYMGAGTDQLMQLAEGVQEGDKHSAALLRNIFFTPAHRKLFIDRMDRIIAGKMGSSPDWAQQRVRQWQERPTSDLPRVAPVGSR